MAGNRALNRTAAAVLGVAAATWLAGCGGGMSGSPSAAGASSSPSLTSRFSELFGGKSQEASATSAPSTQAMENSSELTCPSVAIRFGASTLAVGRPGQPASGNDLRYQGTITRTARDCNLQNGQVTARIGVQGRVIVGPAGAPPTVDLPLRVAVVQEGGASGGGDKVIVTKAFRTSVAIPPDNQSVEFSVVAEEVTYPAPTAAANDKYVFYVGFDPAGLKPEAPARRKRK